MGLSGTFVGRNLIASAGLISTGIMATAFQALVLCSAAVIYHLHLAPAAVVQVCPVSSYPCLQNASAGLAGLTRLIGQYHMHKNIPLSHDAGLLMYEESQSVPEAVPRLLNDTTIS